jgi:hypothetical protein
MIFSALFLMATIYAACGALACHVAMNRIKSRWLEANVGSGHRLNLLLEAQEMQAYRDKYLVALVGSLVLLVASVL